MCLAPLQAVVANRPWELVAVDILQVPMSRQGNLYMLVVQDYFSKWPFAVPLSDQTVNKIVQALKDQVFTLVGPPQRLHSDQGRDFESQILSELCKAFGVTKGLAIPLDNPTKGKLDPCWTGPWTVGTTEHKNRDEQ